MNTFESKNEQVKLVKTYEGIGELVVGGSDLTRVIVTALCMVNNPTVNQYFLDGQLNLKDRITKTRIFPRDGMALPNGQTYVAPVVEEVSVDNQTEESS